MAADARYARPAFRRGMDHEHYAWSPLNATRPQLRWPHEARVAVCAIVSLGHAEWKRPEGSYQPPNFAGGYGWGPFPDVTAWSHREYGHRVGVFRVLDVLEKHGIPPTIAIDAMTARHYPWLVRHCSARGGEIVAHGLSASRPITSLMSEAEERGYIRTSLDAVAQATGTAPTGWWGPEAGESERTPRLLAEAGIRYVCDWANDEQPYRMNVPQGELCALPVSLPLDDVNALWDRRIEIDRYGRMIEETFDVLYRDGAANPRLLALPLHPFLIGQPFRIGYLDAALAHVVAHEHVWRATGSQIIREAFPPPRGEG